MINWLGDRRIRYIDLLTGWLTDKSKEPWWYETRYSFLFAREKLPRIMILLGTTPFLRPVRYNTGKENEHIFILFELE